MGAFKGAQRQFPSKRRSRDQASQSAGPCLWIMSRHEYRRIAPDFAKARDIAQHQRASVQCCFKDTEAEWLVNRGMGENRRTRVIAGEFMRRDLAQQLAVIKRDFLPVR